MLEQNSQRDQQISEAKNTKREILKTTFKVFCIALKWVYRIWYLINGVGVEPWSE
ncbi:hypothetical protein [Shewanella decolorationis]|uniref:Uncharacterized protein n=1 Tax=Shewanella decolorationis S12 TaxID=1353536 RepID=A0ABN0PKS0_9GAMM|nr:hypothetical protein [Shewanella decolorationis]ESE40644.1 hypothetical protein SHD_2804 [Shewanella decolorationis S12]GLR33079.1 hypothetical protein GCM10007922_26380 [Shewanella decolorationis]